MKTRFLHFTTIPALLFLCQCETMDESTGAGASNNLSESAQVSQNVYEQAYQLGADDRKSGRTKDLSRYEGRYPAGESDAFSIGYEKGFAGTPMESAPAGNLSEGAQVSQNVYDQAVQLGRDDAKSGRSRDPKRYDGRYPAGESDAFAMGYEKGYNSGL